MKIGIKYCGGCNPRYQRSEQVRKLQESLKNFEFTYNAAEVCDLWITVSGCPSACGDSMQLKAKYGTIHVSKAKDFIPLRKQIIQIEKEQEHRKQHWTNDGKRMLRTGEKAYIEKVIDEEMVAAFARLTGDFNPIHTDHDYASKTIYRRPIAHGMLAADLISSVMGTELPGAGTILSEINFRFLMPVYPGDRIRAEVIFESYEEHPNHYNGFFSGRCVNQDGVCTVEAQCRQVLPKKLFTVVDADLNRMNEQEGTK